MTVDIETLYEQLAQFGTAPVHGCSLFGTGYEPHFERLREQYFKKRFAKGSSAHKFAIGPFGSGKTHFLRQLMEIAREEDCVTIEVPLNKNLDFTRLNVVYREMTESIVAPGSERRGISGLVRDAVSRIGSRAEAAGLEPTSVVRQWATGLADAGLELEAFSRVARLSIDALLDDNIETFESGCRWMAGEFTDPLVAKRVGEVPTKSEELNIRSHRARQALYQFIKYCGYRGTVVCFDEAEQGMVVEKKRMLKIFSHLLSELNAAVDLQRGSALIVYAVTPDIIDKIQLEMPMLQSRLADPGEGLRFFDGNVLAPKVDLTRQEDSYADLARIGGKLTLLFFDSHPEADVGRRDEALAGVPAVVNEVMSVDAASSARRELVRRVCSGLVMTYVKTPGAFRPEPPRREAEV